MKIVFASSEAVPFAKTGGLADVSAALPKALSAAGHHVTLFLPDYRRISNGSTPQSRAIKQRIRVPIGEKPVDGAIWQTKLPGSDVTVYLIDQPEYFHRGGLYQEDGQDFRDNCERFVFFSRAVMEATRLLKLQPEIIHVNDWQTALIPALLEIEYRDLPAFEQTASVFTIHNIAYQGQFWHWDMLLTGLDWKYFNWRQMEYFGNLNLLKTGIAFADMITTVSPTYAQEIQSADFGYGLQGVLSSRSDDLVGILNGVDTTIWNPSTDPALAQNYTAGTVAEGKAVCKAALQQQTGLPIKSDVPLIAMISRMADQKGLDLIDDCAEFCLELDLQMVFLGTGEAKYERMLRDLAQRFPEKVAVTIGFDEQLAHQMEAGADAYLMPSRFEPCGLNQMYSLLYGTLPIVRAVGGLADSVVDATPENVQNGTANGFAFREYQGTQLYRNVRRMVDQFSDRENWLQMVQSGMLQDWSWRQSAQRYESVYERATAKHVNPEPATTPGLLTPNS